jgi:YD repeat-containing protein
MHGRVIINRALVTRSPLAADRTGRMNENYDVRGCVHRLEQRRFEKYGLDNGPNRESFDVEFSPTGQVLQQTDYANAGGIYRTSRFTYDDAGRLVRAVEFDEAGIEVAISEFEYSGGRQVCTIIDASGVVTGRHVDEYDGDVLTVMGIYDANGQPRRLKFFEYVEGKLCQSISKYYGYDGKFYKQWVTTYDSAGRVAKTFGLKADGSMLGDGKYMYEYDGEGRPSKVWTFNDWEDVANAVTVSEYVYDQNGNWTERSEYHRSKRDSNWTKKITTRRLTYFPVGDFC